MADQATNDNTGQTLLAILNSVVSWVTSPTQQADTIAQVLGVWTAARAAVSTVANGIAAAATQTTLNNAMAKYHDIPLTPPVLADMIVRNILPDSTGSVTLPSSNYPAPYMAGLDSGTASDEALLTGIDNQRFKAMVYDTGESYGIIDAVRLYNRYNNLHQFTQNAKYVLGQGVFSASGTPDNSHAIDETELYRVMAYSRMRPEFVPDILKLSRDTMSGADAIELAVKGILSVDDASTLYQAAGGMPEQFELLYRGAGDAAGLQHAVELYAHGLITEAQLEEIIGMSRLNPAFYYLYTPNENGTIPMNRRWLPVFELSRMVETGLMTKADGITYMTEQGYSTADATLFFQAAELSRVVGIRGATESQIATDWQAGLITNAQATEALSNLGYQDWAIPIILDTYEARKVMSARNAVVTRVRSSLIVGGVTSAEALADLQAVGFSQLAAQDMVAEWTIEANTPNKMMPYTVVGYLLEARLMGTDDGVNYFRRSGYTEQDAKLMVAYYQSGITGPPASVSGTKGPVTEEAPPAVPPPPSRQPITELGPPLP